MCGAGARAVKMGPSFRRSSMDKAPQNTLGTAPVGRTSDEARHAGRQHIGFIKYSAPALAFSVRTPTLHVAAP